MNIFLILYLLSVIIGNLSSYFVSVIVLNTLYA